MAGPVDYGTAKSMRCKLQIQLRDVLLKDGMLLDGTAPCLLIALGWLPEDPLDPLKEEPKW